MLIAQKLKIAEILTEVLNFHLFLPIQAATIIFLTCALETYLHQIHLLTRTTDIKPQSHLFVWVFYHSVFEMKYRNVDLFFNIH